MIKLLLAIFSLILLTSCEEKIDDQYSKVINFFEHKKIGSSPDQVLLKDGWASKREPVAVFFGFMNDNEQCNKIADYYNYLERREGAPGSFYCERIGKFE